MQSLTRTRVSAIICAVGRVICAVAGGPWQRGRESYTGDYVNDRPFMPPIVFFRIEMRQCAG